MVKNKIKNKNKNQNACKYILKKVDGPSIPDRKNVKSNREATKETITTISCTVPLVLDWVYNKSSCLSYFRVA